ncbi:hypothetical protein [Streptomyces marianii]|uniref:hypothetical protein n=1 Tax=Streptomyces marianii TaxID=1817406 RepID=UPI0014867BF0|nr:hypothetical protein [Streptomyces marianii]
MTQKPPEHTRKPRENRILAEPATVARCREDHEAGKADRVTAFKQWRRTGGA